MDSKWCTFRKTVNLRTGVHTWVIYNERNVDRKSGVPDNKYKNEMGGQLEMQIIQFSSSSPSRIFVGFEWG